MYFLITLREFPTCIQYVLTIFIPDFSFPKSSKTYLHFPTLFCSNFMFFFCDLLSPIRAAHGYGAWSPTYQRHTPGENWLPLLLQPSAVYSFLARGWDWSPSILYWQLSTMYRSLARKRGCWGPPPLCDGCHQLSMAHQLGLELVPLHSMLEYWLA